MDKLGKLIEVTFNATGRTRLYNVFVLLGVQGKQIMSANPFHISRVPLSITDDEYTALSRKYPLPARQSEPKPIPVKVDEPEVRVPESVVTDEPETTDTTTVLTEKPKRGRKPKAA